MLNEAEKRVEFDRVIFRNKAVGWAIEMLASPDKWLILDTETTGLDPKAEIVQIGMLRPDGSVLLNTLVMPTKDCPMSETATKVHGISREYLTEQNAPTFPAVYPIIEKLFADGVNVVTYNVAFDIAKLDYVCKLHGLPVLGTGRWDCAMTANADYVGEINEYGKYRWPRLEGGDHSAIGDCRATLALMRRMAASGGSSSSNVNLAEKAGVKVKVIS